MLQSCDRKTVTTDDADGNHREPAQTDNPVWDVRNVRRRDKKRGGCDHLDGKEIMLLPGDDGWAEHDSGREENQLVEWMDVNAPLVFERHSRIESDKRKPQGH